jgi:L-malate glycosyltransferase
MPWGGSEELWAATAQEARLRGHDVAVSTILADPLPRRIKELIEIGVVVHFRDYRPRRLGRLRNLLRPNPWTPFFQFDPDFVLLSQGSAYSTAKFPDMSAAKQWLLSTRIPYAIVNHGDLESIIPDEQTRDETVLFFRRASWVAFVSERSIRVFERQTASRLRNVVVVRNPVNLSSLTAVDWPCGIEARFGCVGFLDATVKGYDLLLDAFSGERWRRRSWRLSLAGTGPHQPYLEALARHYAISDRVEFVGHVDDLRDFWANRELLLMPSRTEGVPLAMVEAMVCGRPVLATDVGGIGEWIQEPDTGFIAPGATSCAVADALERAWQARGKWRSMGMMARESAMQRIDPDPGRTLFHMLAAMDRRIVSEARLAESGGGCR